MSSDCLQLPLIENYGLISDRFRLHPKTTVVAMMLYISWELTRPQSTTHVRFGE